MYQHFEIRAIPLDSRWFRQRVSQFLSSCGLRFDEGLQYMAGIYDSDDKLVGCGGLDGHTVKCLALSEETRGQNVASTLVSHLYSVARNSGEPYVTLFTKPENVDMFRSLGFQLIGEAPKAVMMQSSRKGLDDYVAHLRSLPRSNRNGVIVMNANPLTKGHLYLIEKAASECDCLTVIPVADNPASLYPYSTRRSILLQACSAFPNVTVAEGSEYAVSASTFPSYFLKEKNDATPTHITLDLDIFSTHLAPALDATVRFVGSEPMDPLTDLYNEMMHDILPDTGIEVVEITRKESDGGPISASRVRKLTADGHLREAIDLVAPDSIPYLLAQGAALALRSELDLTPKPGLVDLHDSGSHKDMDHALMAKSISTLTPWFAEMAMVACHAPSGEEMEERIAQLVDTARDAEQDMLEATGGVNTHRGAIFSLGLMTSAAAALITSGKELTPDSLSAEVAAMAALISRPEESHGSLANKKYGAGGALELARGGYATLFSEWLPALRQWRAEAKAQGLDLDADRSAELRTLLLIISSLDDTNALYRVGPEEASASRKEAAALLEDFSVEGLERLNEGFIERNVSHGGAADMLALTLFADSLLK